MSQVPRYLFQPRGLDENGEPVRRLIVEPERLIVSEDDYETIDVPFEILGTQVTDMASSFTGMAVEFIRHINGCFHVAIQPAGRLPLKNEPVKVLDFDIRGCTGEKIIALSEAEKKESQREKPSPDGEFDRYLLPKCVSFNRME